jgi:hypothetical protein
MLDPDLKVFYPLEDNETLAAWRPWQRIQNWSRGSQAMTSPFFIQTRQNNTLTRNNCPVGATMAMTLRPGERLERYWSNWESIMTIIFKTPPPAFGNMEALFYELPCAAFSQKGFPSLVNIFSARRRILGRPRYIWPRPKGRAMLICTMRSPYVFVGGVLRHGNCGLQRVRYPYH